MDSIKNSVLLTVDRCTGIATVVGPQESQFQELTALAFGPDETLYLFLSISDPAFQRFSNYDLKCLSLSLKNQPGKAINRSNLH